MITSKDKIASKDKTVGSAHTRKLFVKSLTKTLMFYAARGLALFAAVILLSIMLIACGMGNGFDSDDSGLEVDDYEAGDGGILPPFPYEGLQMPSHEILPDTIRVLINTCGFASLIHETVTITATGAFWVWGGGHEERFEAGEVFSLAFESSTNVNAGTSTEARIGNWNMPRSPVYFIEAEDDDARLKIIGLTRNHPNGATPTYRGVFEVARVDGGFTVINELCLEQYLYAVVPSEMPSAFGVEASKVQAVTARSFAVRQPELNRFRDFGADVDDSVISQVYNNLPETDTAIQAVRATRGQVLKYDGEVIMANYFSTSGGTTANFGEVWAIGEDFPSNTPNFLRARAQFVADGFPHPGDLRTEDAAAAFFRTTEIPAFDREFPWFRWEVTMTAAQLGYRVNGSLAARQAANHALIHMYCINGRLVSGGRAGDSTSNAASPTIGTFVDIEVTQRGQGGNIMEMVFHGTEGMARVQTEFNIRALLAPREIPVTRHDGSTVTPLGLLPSAFFTMEMHENAQGQLTAVTFFGGGNGHGVGMSQNGVRALLDMGLTYMQILRHFYPGVEIVRMVV